jgi:dTDP-glucose pyrophosphorylase
MSYDWKNVLLKPNDPIRNALKLIEKESLKIALVVDEKLNLLGIVTDGDIRRGLLQSLSVDSPVNEVMNKSPLIAEYGTPRKELLKIMEKEQLLSIPLIKNGVVAGVETFQHPKDIHIYQNPVFLMAGGFGSRLRPLTDNCPKPMLKIAEKPILELLINNFIKAGFINFYISTHYLGHMISDYFGDGSNWNINIQYVHEDEPLGTGGALGLLPNDMPDLPLIVVNGDIVTDVDFERVIHFHNKNNAEATICVRDYEYQIPFGVINGEGNRITSMEEKPVQQFFVNAGMYVISRNILKAVPKNTYIDMPTLLEKYIEVNKGVMMFPVHEYWIDIGRLQDYKRAEIDRINLGF